jgi:Transposase IS116/IS110/IS902 family
MDEHVQRLSRDLRDASYTLSDDEARFLVDAYYIIQEDRKRSGNQVRSMENEPHQLLLWFFKQNQILENQLKDALDRYAETKPIGRWMKSIFGIGPVISAGIIANIDIRKTTTAGDLYRFGGVDPSSKWEKGKKRPWNASLKVVYYHIGQCIIFFCNDERSYYGPYFKAKKEYYVQRNESGGNRERALQEASRYDKKTDAYKHCMGGKLPPAHVNAQARRWVTKLFLSHVHELWYELELGEKPPACFAIAHLGHTDYIPPPHRDIPLQGSTLGGKKG